MRFLFVSVLIAAGMIFFEVAHPAVFSGTDPKTIVTPVGPGIAIVTEIDTVRPYAGEQFSISYRLRTASPPVAVDVDPQQFTGFWTEAAGSLEKPDAASSGRNDTPRSEYTLREVIAFPLSSGELVLPAIRLKIKTRGTTPRGPEDWDLICMSEPLPIEVLPVPQVPDRTLPLVGSLDGTLLSNTADPGTVLLELQGTSNLALFDPTSSIRAPAASIVASSVDDEKMLQTIETGGQRSIRLLQRRRWVLRNSIPQSQDSRIERVEIAFFVPETGKWSTKSIPGTRLAGLRMGTDTALAGDLPQPAASQIHGWTLFLWAALALCCIPVWLVIRDPQVRLRVLRSRIFSSISRILFSRP